MWLNIHIDLNFGSRPILKGKFQFKVNKSANLVRLKKKLQKFAIEIWSYKNQPRKKQTNSLIASDDKDKGLVSLSSAQNNHQHYVSSTGSKIKTKYQKSRK